MDLSLGLFLVILIPCLAGPWLAQLRGRRS